ncbi:MAG: hypothetical protein GXO12_06265 [Epsilonproteobacteria bacterium]|nr:hypothetical protein [Campylobacterota bacterium]
MRRFIVVLTFPLMMFAQMISIDDFKTDIFSRVDKNPKEVSLSVIIEGRYVEDESYKITDALNVVIGSFYVEDLLTSKGKEALKKLLIDYTAKKYGIDIDEVYIQKLMIDQNPSTNDIISALKKEGCCK